MNIDFKLLADQKLELVGLAMENQSGTKELEAGFLTKNQADALDGVIGLLDAIQDKQEDNKALKTTWDFVLKYYPDYSSSDEICRANDLFLILERRNTIMDEEGTELHARYMNEFSGRIFHVYQEYDLLMKEIYEQAINNFIQSQNK